MDGQTDGRNCDSICALTAKAQRLKRIGPCTSYSGIRVHKTPDVGLRGLYIDAYTNLFYLLTPTCINDIASEAAINMQIRR